MLPACMPARGHAQRGDSLPELGLVVGVHLLIYDLDDLRGALRPDVQDGRPVVMRRLYASGFGA